MPKLKVGALVTVHWFDSAASPAYWIDEGRTLPMANCKTVGWVIDKTRDSVTLAQSKAPEQTGGLFVIPRAVIKKVVCHA